MLTAIGFYNYLPDGILDDLEDMTSWLRALPNKPGGKSEGKLWSCHGLTRAAKIRYGLTAWEVCDGFFGSRGTCHSWLLLPESGSNPSLVFDVYPMGGVGSFIVSMQWQLPWKKFYIPAPEYYGDGITLFEEEARLILSMPRMG